MTDLPNIVLVVLDTLRKDVLPVYGGSAQAPNVDALISDGVCYPNCIAPSPWTLPSHASLFTGKYPSQHGMHESKELKNPKLFDLMAKSGEETLADYMRQRGYNTVGISANPSVAPGSGFDNGFNAFTLTDATKPNADERRAVELASKYGRTRGEATTNLLKKGKIMELWRLYSVGRTMQRRQEMANFPMVKGGDAITEIVTESSFEEPFFLFLNLFEMHEPYTKDEPLALLDLFGKRTIEGEMLTRIRQKYADEVRLVDSFLGSIMKYLKDCGAYDQSMVVLTSDHGQSLKERGFYGHGTFLYPELVEIPLVVKYPGNKKPQVAGGNQSLTRVPEVLKDSLVGITDGVSLSAKSAVSESFGIPQGLETVKDVPDYETMRDKFDRPRKAIYQDGYRLVVDGGAGKIEAFERNNQTLTPGESKDIVNDMLGQLASLRDTNFVMPDRV